MKYLKVNDQMREDILKKLVEDLNKATTTTELEKIKVEVASVYKPQDIPCPTILYTPEALAKIQALVDTCTVEIQFHGLVKYNEETHTFLVHEILLFKQKISAALCDTDEEEYAEWMAHNIMDPKFPLEELRFHGHSHVNMGTTPSAVDDRYQADILVNIRDFYLFAIYNKRKEMHHQIYDLKRNIVYDNRDITVGVTLDGENLAMKWAQTQIDKYTRPINYAVPIPVKKEPDRRETRRTANAFRSAKAHMSLSDRNEIWDFWDNLVKPKDPIKGQLEWGDML